MDTLPLDKFRYEVQEEEDMETNSFFKSIPQASRQNSRAEKEEEKNKGRHTPFPPRPLKAYRMLATLFRILSQANFLTLYCFAFFHRWPYARPKSFDENICRSQHLFQLYRECQVPAAFGSRRNWKLDVGLSSKNSDSLIDCVCVCALKISIEMAFRSIKC